jgi:hypothetical protein
MLPRRALAACACATLAIAGCSNDSTAPTDSSGAVNGPYGSLLQHRGVQALSFAQSGNVRRFVLPPGRGNAPGPKFPIFTFESQALDGYTGVTFEGRAVVAPPQVAGEAVQITDMVIDSDGKLGVATANYAGEVAKGALQLFDVSDPYNPVMTAEVLFADAEYNSAVLAGTVAYVLGNDRQGAIVDAYDVSDPASPRLASRVALGAHTALAALASGSHLSVVTGDNGGLFLLDASDGLAPAETGLVELADARNLARAPGGVAVLTGQGVVFVQTDGGIDLVPIAGLPPMAPTRGVVVGDVYYVNSSDGIVAVDLINHEARLAMPWADGTPNGLATDDGLLFFRANGEAGLQLAHHSAADVYTALGTLDLANAGSSNSVAVGNHVWFSGDGRGGVLIGAFQYDIFDDFSGKLLVPYPWTQVYGHWLVAQKDGRSTFTCPVAGNPADRRVFWNNEAMWSDVQVDVVAYLDQGKGYGIYFRAQDVLDDTKQDSYVFQYDPGWQSGSFMFRRIHDGQETTPLAFVEKRNISALANAPWYGTWRHCRVAVQGDWLRAWVDGVLVVEVHDSVFTAGTVGFRLWSDSQAWFDEVRVTPL